MQTLHIISHTHWDREWYQTFQQFRLKLVHLVDGLLNLLDQDPDFKHFMLDGQTIVLDDYLFMRPEKESILRQHIQDGRILIGPWHILPDMFLVSPEAHVRNLLQGARTARRFGPKMPVGYIPDPFGHPGQVPQILRGFGIEAAALWRGVDDQPCEFWWQSPDGSKVFMAFLRDSYSNGASLSLEQARDSLAAHSAAQDYLIMLGTDHMEPSASTTATIASANENLKDTSVVHSTFPQYLAALAGKLDMDSLPIVSGELRACSRSPLLPGVLSTRIWIKQRNRACESLLEKWAEPYSVFAGEVGKNGDSQLGDRLQNPAAIIRQAWRLLMENHPHDSICGCSIDQVHDEMESRFDQAEQIGDEITRQSMQSLADTVNTQSTEALSAVVAFNPTGKQRTGLVNATLNIPDDLSDFEIVDSSGAVLPFEMADSSSQEFANVVMPKESARVMLGMIHDGQIAGMSITHVKLERQESTVLIDATFDQHASPNITAWREAERQMAEYLADPDIVHVHILGHSPRASSVRFLAPEVPAHGWRTYKVRAADAPPAPPPTQVNPLLKPLLPVVMRFAQSEMGGKLMARLTPAEGSKPPYIIENEYFKVEADAGDGTLVINDKRSGVVYRGLNRFVDGGDAGDEYNYSPPAQDRFVTAQVKSLRVVASGLAQTLVIESRLQSPSSLTSGRDGRSDQITEIPIISHVSVSPGIPRVDVQTEIDNQAKDHRLRVHFPAPILVDSADYDGHFEVVRRPLGVPEKGENWVESPRPEVPQRAFTDIFNGAIGLAIANRGLPEVEVIAKPESGETEIALTLQRCVGWLSRDDLSTRPGHAGPSYETPGAQLPGKWAFNYAIIPHSKDVLEAYHQAYAFEVPMRAVATGLHDGNLPAQAAFISCSTAEFVISTIKEAEDGRGWILRGYNIGSQPIDVTLRPWKSYAYAEQVNMAEETITKLETAEDGSVSLAVGGHKVVTVLYSE